MEIRKDAVGYEGLYQVSNSGRVRSLWHKTKILKPFLDGKKYLTVDLHYKTGRKNMKVHRLVAEAFIPNPLDKQQINHIDGNKQNNDVTNLEWNTQSENIKHAYKLGLIVRNDNAGKSKKPVYQLKNGKIINRFNSVCEAERLTNTPRQNIRKVINGERASANGYQWADAK